LPVRYKESLLRAANREGFAFSDLNELRMRLLQPSSVTVAGENILLDVRLCEREIWDCIAALCGGSVYAHADTMGQGYIRFGDGIRVGVCGDYADGMFSLRSVRALNIRIPHLIRDVSRRISELLYNSGRISSALLYSPPGIGKTTVLRDISSLLGGKYRLRIAVIDSRGELYIAKQFENTLCDFLTGNTKAAGIEIATRTMAPQVLICDEIGDLDEAKQILSAQNTGVPLIASAHASGTDELLSRPNIRTLHENGVFRYYIGIHREACGKRLGRCFRFDIVSAEDIRCIS